MARPSTDLDPEQIESLLSELGQRLRARGVEGQLYVVGGAAIALEVDTRRVTVDVDAVLHPEATVRGEAAAMAADHGLPEDWLDDTVKAFLPGGDAEAVLWSVPGVSVALASPRHLLAMKMAAYRPGQDQDDLVLLFGELNVTTPEQAVDMALEVDGEHTAVLPDRAELILAARAILARMEQRREGT